MIATAISIAGGIWRRVILPLAPWILVAVLGAVVWTYVPVIGPRAEAARVVAQRDVALAAAKAWEGHARGWQASYHAAQGIRANEQENARQAASQAAASCLNQIERARASARVIERIVTREPTYDANRCPVRELVDPDQLRDAISPR